VEQGAYTDLQHAATLNIRAPGQVAGRPVMRRGSLLAAGQGVVGASAARPLAVGTSPTITPAQMATVRQHVKAIAAARAESKAALRGNPMLSRFGTLPSASAKAGAR
jgi:hypothetical protein